MLSLIKYASFSLLISSSLFAMVCSDFGDFKQYGTHYYSITGSKYTFAQAKQIAENNGGYLAIPNDAGENSFLATTFGTAWIGIYDPNLTQNLCYYGNTCPSDPSRFKTVQNATPSYTNWASGEPNNPVYQYDIVEGKQMVSPLGEHWTVIGQNGQWGSFGNHAQDPNNPVQFKAIFEFDTKPECVVGGSTTEPVTDRKCTDSIYNSGTSSTGQIINDTSGYVAMTSSNTYTCQTDTYGNEFCPAQLAPCSTVWGYQDGYAVSNQICSDGTQPVNGMCKSTTKACDAVGGVWNGTNCTITDYYNFSCTPTSVLFSGSYGNLPAQLRYGAEGDIATAWGRCHEWDNRNIYGRFICKNSKWIYMDGGSSGYYAPIPTQYQSSASANTASYGTSGSNDGICPRKDWQGWFVNISGGYNVSSVTGIGYAPPSCSNVSSDGYCYMQPMTYYTYLCSSGTNEYGQSYTPTVTSGTSSTPPTNNCKIESFSCVPATDRKCAYVNSSWQCSPFPCFGESNLESADTTVGATDSASKGFNTDGSCSYQIRLFNGKDMRCRSWDALFGLIGGGCCQRDNGSGLGALFGGQCKEDERLLAKYRKETQDKSHYIGEYCSKYLKLGFAKICIQKKKTYCVFNSKLARIIHEQGRPQIGIDWGAAQAPNCKGFTPEEFQKIDFSKLDLSEFYGDLQSKIQTTIDAKVGTTIQQKVQSFGVNISGGSN